MIKFVYFDVGGVLIRDFSGTNKWQEMKRDMGITSKQDREFDEFFVKYEKEVCLGRDLETLVPLIQQRFGIKFPDDYSFLDDFVGRFEKNEPIWPIVKKAQKRFRVGLLTDMYPGMLDLIKKRDLLPDVRWEVIIDSSVVDCKKPDSEIYRLAQERVRVEGKEILFVENKLVNIKSAAGMDWQTFCYKPTDIMKSNRGLVSILGLEGKTFPPLG